MTQRSTACRSFAAAVRGRTRRRPAAPGPSRPPPLISTGGQLLNQDAQQISNPGNQNLTAPLAGLSQANLLAEAGADVIRTANQTLGSLLDVFA